MAGLVDEEIAKNWKTFSPDMFLPSYTGMPTFFGIPYREDVKGLDIALVGVPFDLGVTMRSGARMGPREIRNQSRLMGVYNHAMRMTPFADFRVADVGDVPFQTTYHLEDAQRDIEAFYTRISSAGVVPVTAGGDHSITFPILKAVALKKKVGLVHFDTHCDTAEPYAGSGLNHGCPFRNAVVSGLVDPERAIQIGIRGGFEPLWEFSYESGMRVVQIEEFYELGGKRVAEEIRRMMGDAPVYISFDIDCLDPAFAPGTGTPAAGGMSTFEALQTLRGLNIIGGDVVEVAPPFDSAGITALAGATIHVRDPLPGCGVPGAESFVIRSVLPGARGGRRRTPFW